MQCLTEAKMYGEVIPGWYLVKATKTSPWGHWPAGYWGLVRMNDPDFVWEPDPLEEDPEAPVDENGLSEFYRRHNDFEEALHSHPNVGYTLIKDAMKVGYNPEEEGYVTFWLFERMARMLSDGSLKEGAEPKPTEG